MSRRPRTARARFRGFTLLEVLIAVTILSLGLSTVFGTTIMASRSTAHARMITQAALYAQCRMTNVEAYLRQNQLPVADQVLDDPPAFGGEPCCPEPYSCRASVDRIELPPPATVSTAAGDQMLGRAAESARGTSFGSLGGGGDGGLGGLGGGDGGLGGLSGIGALAGALGSLGSGQSDPSGGIAGALSSVTGGDGGVGGAAGAAGSLRSMAGQLLSGIYPTIKPVLEGAIRRVLITVRWTEGEREFSFEVVQYVTNPGQTMQTGTTLDAVDRLLGGGAAGAGAGGAAGATPAASTPAASSPASLLQGLH